MTVHSDYKRIHAEATALAGRPQDLIQRVSVYYHLHEHSGGNHVFPLLAAHGALWGSAHFRKGLAIGRVLSCARPDLRQERIAALDAFATAFKDINRRVCIETYTSYFLTARHDDADALSQYYPRALVDALHACHAARRAGRDMTVAEKRDLFERFFLWEQDNVVGPSVEQAVAAFDWPMLMHLAMRPAIGFRYFPRFKRLWFTAFHNTSQRIDRGFEAFELAARVGWDRTRASISDYAVMPRSFGQAPLDHFRQVRADLALMAA